MQLLHFRPVDKIVYSQCLTLEKKMLDAGNRNQAVYIETKHLVVGNIKQFEMNDKTHQWFVGSIHKADLDSQSLVIQHRCYLAY